MSEWQPIETAPKDAPFLALNFDHEVHVAKFDDRGRLMFRTHQQRFPRRYRVENGNKILEHESFEFDTGWTIWMRGYEFKPTRWMSLPEPTA